MAAAASSHDDDDDYADNDNYCPCSNIVIMQLFHELKQKFPTVSDSVVSECIRQNYHDKEACEILLRRENYRYLMHSYPTALKMTTTGEDNVATPGGDRCCTKSHDVVEPSSVCNPTRLQTEFYSSIRETAQVLQNSDKKNVNQSVVRDTVAVKGGGEVVLPAVINMNDGRCYNPSGVTTGTQWYAQGTTQYLPSNNLHDIPIGDSRVRYNQSPRSVIGGSACANGQFTQCNRQQYQDVTITQGVTSQVERVERKTSTTNSSQFYATSDVDSNSNGPEVVFSDPPLQKQHQQRTVASRSSVSVRSTTSYHKHCNRPCSLDVTQTGMSDKVHPRSAPELPNTFEPFGPLRLTEFNTPSTPTTPSDNYLGHNYDTSSSLTNLSANMSENNLNFPLGKLDNVQCQKYDMNVNCTVGTTVSSATAVAAAGGVSSQVYQRARSALNVEPAPHYASRNYWGGGGGTVAIPSTQQSRSYTSVNLTLRPPSLEPLPPIEIASAGSSLTYSTSSYDPRQGYQSQLQIRIGPGGVGSVSALRTRAPEVRPRSCYVPAVEDVNTMSRTESMPDVTALSLVSDDLSMEDSLREVFAGAGQQNSLTKALLLEQVERKNRLRRELKREKQKLRDMHREVQGMAADLAQRQCRQRAANIALPVVTTVLQKVHSLRQEIQFLQKECKKMTTEVDMSSDDQGRDVRSHPPPTSPLEALDLDGPNWTCSECTFRNHPLLDKCEECEMPRIILGETQDIHIRVTHHNYPMRRGVLHSWVV